MLRSFEARMQAVAQLDKTKTPQAGTRDIVNSRTLQITPTNKTGAVF
jgi:hypothetical protein